jgi:hypothetical protein
MREMRWHRVFLDLCITTGEVFSRTTLKRCCGLAKRRSEEMPRHRAISDGCTTTGRVFLRTIIKRCWYRKAAEQGSALAQIFLGESYSAGEGVPQDYNQAVLWFSKAADQGDAAAQSKLAWMYYRGQGVPKDYVEAHKWFNLAAANTSEKESRDKAIKNRDLLAQLMTPTEIAESEKRTRDWKKKRPSLI